MNSDGSAESSPFYCLGVRSSRTNVVRKLNDRRPIQRTHSWRPRLLGSHTTDLGTVVETAWNGVTIEWDDGHTSAIQHNDMAQIERVPTKLV
jgi:hypothetical protein